MAFEKTQNKLDELRNLTWQNGKLVEQIEKLTKMLEEKDDSTLVVEIEEAKKVLAEAINTKGGNSTPDESFQQLAEDVLAMPTSGILANGVVQTEPFSFLTYITSENNDEITEINDSDITTIVRDYAFYRSIALRKVVMARLTTISGSNTFNNCNALQNVQIPNLTTITGSSTFAYCSSLQSIDFPSLITISGHSTFSNCSFLQSVGLGTLTLCAELFYNGKPNLRNITIGKDTDINLPFDKWTAINVISERQSGIDELNNNLYNNLLTKLADHSTDGQTRTLRLGWLAHVTQENIDYANSKGWTLTT